MLELYNYPLSPCGDKVRFVLLEKGLLHQQRVVDLNRKENLEPWYLSLNPKGLVPLLRDGDAVITESTIILEYIEDRFSNTPLRPASPVERAEMRLWTKLVDERLHPLWPGLAWPILVRPRLLEKDAKSLETIFLAMPDVLKREKQKRMLRDGINTPEFLAALKGFSDILDDANDRLCKSQYLAGSNVSLADFSLLPYLFVATLFSLDRMLWEGRGELKQWYETLSRRPAYKDGLEGLYPAQKLESVKSLAKDLMAKSNLAGQEKIIY